MTKIAVGNEVDRQNRYSGLDYLRGLAAFGIMIYHYSSWGFGKMDSSSTLGRIGVYGVSVFYVLSGLTLFLVYGRKMKNNFISIFDFFLKRLFRIFPLLWLITTLTILIKPTSYSWLKIVMNYTGLFSLFAWTEYIGAGVWSIGNELVFYLIFPCLILSLIGNRILFYIIGMLAVISYLFFAFFLYNTQLGLSSQWVLYTNPLNQFFLFWGGVALGHITQNFEFKNAHSLVLIVIAMSVFVFLPSTGDNIAIVSSTNRITFSLLCFIATLGFYKISKVENRIHQPLSFLGEISYSLYLIHPLVFKASTLFLNSFDITYRIVVSIFGSLVISYLVYTFIEKPFINLGKTITNRIKNKGIDTVAQ